MHLCISSLSSSTTSLLMPSPTLDYLTLIIFSLITAFTLSILCSVLNRKKKMYNLTNMKGRVTIYSTTGCPHCKHAKSALNELGIPFVDVNLDNYPQARKEMEEKTNRRTVPQIFFNNIHVGGNDEFSKLEKDRLQELVNEVTNNEPPADAPQIPDPSTAVQSDVSSDIKCEPDEYAVLAKALRESGLVSNHRKNLKWHKKTIIGSEATEWLAKHKNIDIDEALKLGQELIDRYFLHPIHGDRKFENGSSYYRFLEDDDDKALNMEFTSECEPRSASEVGEDLRRLILKTYSKYLSNDGKKIDYKGIAESQEFQEYRRAAAELQRVNVATLSKEEKLAFFINIYNALIVHANITVGPPVTVWQRYRYFNTVSYKIGGYNYTLNEIENGLLRGNRKAVGSFRKPFSKDDPRLPIALTELDSRVHFALVCGARSCPPVKTYSSKEIYEQLQSAGEAFLEGDEALQIGEKEVKVSEIFKWYRVDFGTTDEQVIQRIFEHTGPGSKRNKLQTLLENKSSVKLSYLPYNWDLNSN
ncbi:Glutaredoxin-1 [Trichoplax sp. H2]|nr:Glutaredoxin-1 [Trichoplax sp. H2]|eukprot:RDD47850.1 Glutaredoxin-1 [Trichoplax sp. H2]